jgi:hypothetical protein
LSKFGGVIMAKVKIGDVFVEETDPITDIQFEMFMKPDNDEISINDVNFSEDFDSVLFAVFGEEFAKQ